MEHSPETEMNSISDLREEQGSMPPVPALEVSCEKCKHEFELVEKQLPEECPHCGYRLRPSTDTIWQNFLFVLFHRYAVWQGRATRKEFWSFELISHFLLFLFILANFSAPYFALLAYIPFIGIPQIFLFARRLHDIRLSGVTVIVHLILMVLMFCIMVVTYAIQENITSKICSVDEVATQPYSDIDIEMGDKIHDSLAKTERNSTVYPLILVSYFLNFALQVLSLFFLVITFIDSKRGTTKYGPSRKYPLALS